MKLKTLLVTLIACLIATLSSVDAAEIEEVIVIAEKRSESLQDVSQSVTAITGSELDVKNINDFVGLSSVAQGSLSLKTKGIKPSSRFAELVMKRTKMLSLPPLSPYTWTVFS